MAKPGRPRMLTWARHGARQGTGQVVVGAWPSLGGPGCSPGPGTARGRERGRWWWVHGQAWEAQDAHLGQARREAGNGAGGGGCMAKPGRPRMLTWARHGARQGMGQVVVGAWPSLGGPGCSPGPGTARGREWG